MSRSAKINYRHVPPAVLTASDVAIE